MLKGDVFEYQEFENQIFALFIDLFMNKANGVARTYKNGMNLSYSGHTVTIDSGACLVQGRFLEEDSSTTIDTGIETSFCKLVVEIDLDQTNTRETFNQGAYKIVKDNSAYPSLTQQDTVGTNKGKYQYELARFKISDGVVTEFEDKRTYIEDQLQYGEIDELKSTVANNYRSLSSKMVSKEDSLNSKISHNYSTLNKKFDSYLPTSGGSLTGNLNMEGSLYINRGSIQSENTYNNNTVSNASNMYITSNGWIKRTTNTSSKRYKKDVKDIKEEELNPERLYDLKVKQFKYKKEYQPSEKDKRYNKNLVGFIAEDVAEIYPIAADFNENGEVDNWNERYLIPAMLDLIQKQNERIKALEAKVGVENE